MSDPSDPSAAVDANEGAAARQALPPFRAVFGSWSGRIRRRLAAGPVLTGVALGLAVGAAGAAAAWHFRLGALRPWMAAAGLIGAALGYVISRRRRWSDAHVALWLDARLGSQEAIATAVELDVPCRGGRGGDGDRRSERSSDSEAGAIVIAQASLALNGAARKTVRPPLWRVWHAAAPAGAAAIAYLSIAAVPPPPSPAAPPGLETIRLTDVAGLQKAIALGELNARDAEQRERLKKLAEDAKKLREKLNRGVEKREAQADLAKLRDGIAAERMSLGDGEQRAGMEAAIGKLAENPDTKGVAKALGDHDFAEVDEQMERLANTLEAEAREQAAETLRQAAEAAKNDGAPGVAKALEEQRKNLERSGKRAEKLKQLAEAFGEGLPEGAKKSLEEMQSSGSPEDQQKLAEGLEEALGELSPEERKRLAENLKKQASRLPDDGSDLQPGSKQQTKELADQLDSPEGRKQLAEQLKKMAEEPPPGSEEGQCHGGLNQAEKGLGEAERRMSGTLTPTPVNGGKADARGQRGKAGEPREKGNAKGAGKDGKQKTPGHSEGGGSGDHAGETKKIDGDGVRARARTRIGKGKPMPGMVLGRSAGRPGETANAQGTGSLGAVGAGEIGGVERSDVPEEYREHVGRYFQPK